MVAVEVHIVGVAALIHIGPVGIGHRDQDQVQVFQQVLLFIYQIARYY